MSAWDKWARVCPLDAFTPYQQTAVALIQAGAYHTPEAALRALDKVASERPAERHKGGIYER